MPPVTGQTYRTLEDATFEFFNRPQWFRDHYSSWANLPDEDILLTNYETVPINKPKPGGETAALSVFVLAMPLLIRLHEMVLGDARQEVVPLRSRGQARRNWAALNPMIDWEPELRYRNLPKFEKSGGSRQTVQPWLSYAMSLVNRDPATRQAVDAPLKIKFTLQRVFLGLVTAFWGSNAFRAFCDCTKYGQRDGKMVICAIDGDPRNLSSHNLSLVTEETLENLEHSFSGSGIYPYLYRLQIWSGPNALIRRHWWTDDDTVPTENLHPLQQAWEAYWYDGGNRPSYADYGPDTLPVDSTSSSSEDSPGDAGGWPFEESAGPSLVPVAASSFISAPISQAPSAVPSAVFGAPVTSVEAEAPNMTRAMARRLAGLLSPAAGGDDEAQSAHVPIVRGADLLARQSQRLRATGAREAKRLKTDATRKL